MISGKYFNYSIDNSFAAKFEEVTWNRTEGVERQLCSLLNSSRDAPFTCTHVKALTRWHKHDIKRWLSELMSSGVFVPDECLHVNRWKLRRDFPQDRVSLADLIPPIGCKIENRRQQGELPIPMLLVPSPKPVNPITHSAMDSLPAIDTDNRDDFFAVFSRI